MRRLEAAVRYPGPSRKALHVAVIGAALWLPVLTMTHSIWGSTFLGGLGWLGGAVLIIGRDNQVRNTAVRIFDERPELTAEEAANAARRQLGLRPVRYP